MDFTYELFIHELLLVMKKSCQDNNLIIKIQNHIDFLKKIGNKINFNVFQITKKLLFDIGAYADELVILSGINCILEFDINQLGEWENCILNELLRGICHESRIPVLKFVMEKMEQADGVNHKNFLACLARVDKIFKISCQENLRTSLEFVVLNFDGINLILFIQYKTNLDLFSEYIKRHPDSIKTLKRKYFPETWLELLNLGATIKFEETQPFYDDFCKRQVVLKTTLDDLKIHYYDTNLSNLISEYMCFELPDLFKWCEIYLPSPRTFYDLLGCYK